MRTYIYTYERKKNDVNGNPRHFICVYRLIKNKPVAIGEPNHSVGYRDAEQAVTDLILANEKGWGKRYKGTFGMINPVYEAVRRARYNDPDEDGKKAQLFRVGG